MKSYGALGAPYTCSMPRTHVTLLYTRAAPTNRARMPLQPGKGYAPGIVLRRPINERNMHSSGRAEPELTDYMQIMVVGIRR